MSKYFKIKKQIQKIVFFLFKKIMDYQFIIINGLFQNLKKIKLNNFTWKNIAKDFNERIINFAKKNPDYQIIIKGKIGYSKQQLRYFDKHNFENIKFVNIGNSYELIKSCSIVVAFSSTVLLEAVAANKMIFSPIPRLQKNTYYKNFLLEAKNLILPIENLNNLNDKLKL